MSQSPQDMQAQFRVLDANLNRATEALRVLEEVARFGLNNSFLTAELKSARHSLAEAFRPISNSLLQARDTQHDVGTALVTDSELSRNGFPDIAGANFARLKQSLRCLEEFGKAVESVDSSLVEQIRYRCYTLEKAFRGQLRASPIEDRHVYVLIDGEPTEEQFRDRVQELVAASVDVIQLRDKSLTDRELLERAKLLVELTRKSSVLAIINDRVDIALVCEADGVHVGQDELSVEEVRTLCGTRLIVGASTHSIEQARAAVLSGADYLGVGPTFPSSTKSFETFPGIDLLTAVASEISLPAFAIGGIGPNNIEKVVATGFTRVAVQSALQDVTSIRQNVEQLRDSLFSNVSKQN